MDLVNGETGSARVALNCRYMRYGQRSREAVLGDYERSSALASRANQRFKISFVDRLYQRRCEHYEERTGEGILLNTSFNLHGEPIVHGARDAVGVFVRSGVRAMALGNWWVEKP